MASNVTTFALAYPDITVGRARHISAKSTPSSSCNATPRTSVDVDRKEKGKAKETSTSKTSKDSNPSKTSSRKDLGPSPSSEAMASWFMWK